MPVRLRNCRHLQHFSPLQDRKSTRLNSSHLGISYAFFCLKKSWRDHPPMPACVAPTLPCNLSPAWPLITQGVKPARQRHVQKGFTFQFFLLCPTPPAIPPPPPPRPPRL